MSPLLLAVGLFGALFMFCAGGFIGPIAAFFYCIGFLHLIPLFEKSHEGIAWIAYLCLCMGIIMGGAATALLSLYRGRLVQSDFGDLLHSGIDLFCIDETRRRRMENVIIIGIIVVLVLVGIRSGIKHFKGEGGCCGGGSSVKRKRKKLKNVIAKKIVIIEGMTCEHCKNRVEASIDAIDGAAARVNLGKKEAVVSLEKEVSEEQIRAVIEKAGYTVVEIRG